MTSVFGIVSAVVAAVGVWLLILHFKVTSKRGAADESLMVLDNLLRERLEQMYNETDSTEVAEICENFSALETRKLYRAMPKLEKAAKGMPEETNLEKAVDDFNDKITGYNDYIAKFPARLMAVVLGLRQEKNL